MSDYYKGKRTRNLFQPGSSEPFNLSRSKLENFLKCPRCFYLDCRLGIAQPPGYPFALNSAVDHLLKKEFDIHRAGKTAHPLHTQYKLDVIPFQHPDLNRWREPDFGRGGVRFFHQQTNFMIYGAVDDIWIATKDSEITKVGDLHVVDYKSTSKDTEVNLDADWQKGYKNQAEIYQWLLRQNKFPVSNTAYFVYANGQKDRKAFDGKLEFDVSIIPYSGSDAWVEPAIIEAKQCLMSTDLPDYSPECDYCLYRQISREAESKMVQSRLL